MHWLAKTGGRAVQLRGKLEKVVNACGVQGAGSCCARCHALGVPLKLTVDCGSQGCHSILRDLAVNVHWAVGCRRRGRLSLKGPGRAWGLARCAPGGVTRRRGWSSKDAEVLLRGVRWPDGRLRDPGVCSSGAYAGAAEVLGHALEPNEELLLANIPWWPAAMEETGPN